MSNTSAQAGRARVLQLTQIDRLVRDVADWIDYCVGMSWHGEGEPARLAADRLDGGAIMLRKHHILRSSLGGRVCPAAKQSKSGSSS